MTEAFIMHFDQIDQKWYWDYADFDEDDPPKGDHMISSVGTKHWEGDTLKVIDHRKCHG